MQQVTQEEMSLVIGGAYPSQSIDPETGEVVTYDCTGREIGREPASYNG